METIRELRLRHRQEALDHRLNPRDVDLLLSDAMAKPLSYLIGHDELEISDEAHSLFIRNLGRRLAGEPLQYIRGRTEFYGREFLVDDRVLIPRPETELLVEQVLLILPSATPRILDVGTGSSCIASTLALERTDATLFGSDTSVAALALAQKNIERTGARVHLFGADLLFPVRGRFDAIVSNPPYVGTDEIEHLQIEVARHEPLVALTPGQDGLAAIRSLIASSREHLTPTGFLALEIGIDQSAGVRHLAASAGYPRCMISEDLAAIPRVAVLWNG